MSATEKECMYLTFIVDRSGSMYSCGISVFEGITDCIKKKMKFAEEKNMNIFLTIFTFDDQIERLNIPNNPNELKNEHYSIIKSGVEPRGWTSLYDAIHQASMYVTETQDKRGDSNSSGFMVIITDGEDNKSDVTLDDVKKEIESHKKTGMEYIFIGANIDAKYTGSTLGIPENACLQFSPDPTLTQTTFENLGLAMQRSIETDGEGFQFSQLERQTSCNPLDQRRFNVNTESKTDTSSLKIFSMDEILKIKAKEGMTWGNRRKIISNSYDEDEDEDDISLYKDIEESQGDIFSNGVSNVLNLETVNDKK